MPVYYIQELKKKRGKANTAIINQSVTGELMNAGIVTKPEGEGPPSAYASERRAIYVDFRRKGSYDFGG